MTKAKFDVSIVIPCFNHQEYISETIRSVLDTGFKLQVIVIDDGSTDFSYERALATLNDHKKDLDFYIEKNENQGLINSLNRGFDLAEAPIIGQLASDDMYTPGQIEAAVKCLRGQPDVGLVFALPNIIDEDGFVSGPLVKHSSWMDYILQNPARSHKELLCKNFLPASTIFYRKEALDQSGRMDPLLVNRGEISLHWKIAERWKLSCISQYHGYYRVHPRSNWLAMKKDIGKLRDDYIQLMNNYFSGSDVDDKSIVQAISYVKYDYDKLGFRSSEKFMDRISCLAGVVSKPRFLIRDFRKKLMS